MAVKHDDSDSDLSSPGPARTKDEPDSKSPAGDSPDTQSSGDANGDVKAKMEKMKVSRGPPTFMDLPCATEEATSKFTVIPISSYYPKSLGDAPQDEAMSCECRAEFSDGVNHACGPDSDCINRYTSMECSGSGCGCGKDCQNMRFQRKQYADVSVIKTEFKGYGLRANENLTEGQFIYEYVGEVVDENRFRKRRLDYDKEGIKHFYFMSLGKNEFVDATKKGNLARFCNHSCNPNCYVDKWIVGTKFRMGIFAKRKVIKGEELTFDYNVDRYGADAQKCYCGEPNCMGYIGGKTQTDGKSTAKVSDQIADALGVHETGRRGRKTVGIDEAFVKVLVPRPLEMPGVRAVTTVLLANTESWIVEKVLERVHACDDMDVQMQIMRAHGYQIMNGILKRFDSTQIAIYILDILLNWPRLTKNKINASKIEEQIKALKDSPDEDVQSKAKKLLKEWAKLDTAYRIPRRIRTDDDPSTPTSDSAPGTPKPSDAPNPAPTPTPTVGQFRPHHIKKHIPGAPSGPKLDRQKKQEEDFSNLGPLPPGWSIDVRNGRRVYVSVDNLQIQEKFPTAPYVTARAPLVDKNKLMLQQIMEKAEAAVRLRKLEEKAEMERKEREEEEKRRREEEEREDYLKSLDELIRKDIEEERRAAKEKARKERAEKRRKEKRERVEKKLSEKEIERALLKTHGPVIANIIHKSSPWLAHKKSKSQHPPPPSKDDWKLLTSWLTRKIVASEIKKKGEYYCDLKKVPTKGTGYYKKMEDFVGETMKKGRTWVTGKIETLRKEKEEEEARKVAEGRTPQPTETASTSQDASPTKADDAEDNDSEVDEPVLSIEGTPAKRAREEDEEEQAEVERAVRERRREIERNGVWKGRDIREVVGFAPSSTNITTAASTSATVQSPPGSASVETPATTISETTAPSSIAGTTLTSTSTTPTATPRDLTGKRSESHPDAMDVDEPLQSLTGGLKPGIQGVDDVISPISAELGAKTEGLEIAEREGDGGGGMEVEVAGVKA